MSHHQSRILFIIVLVTIGIVLIYTLFAPPDAFKYFTYLKEAKTTKDIVTRYNCDTITLQSTQTDFAENGVSPGPGYTGRGPELVTVYILEGFRDNNLLFSTAYTLQNWSLPRKYVRTVERSYDLPHHIEVAYVINRLEYEKMVTEYLRYRDSNTLLFKNSSSVKESDIRDLARCYTIHQNELNKPLGASISSFVVPAETTSLKGPVEADRTIYLDHN